MAKEVWAVAAEAVVAEAVEAWALAEGAEAEGLGKAPGVKGNLARPRMASLDQRKAQTPSCPHKC